MDTATVDDNAGELKKALVKIYTMIPKKEYARKHMRNADIMLWQIEIIAREALAAEKEER